MKKLLLVALATFAVAAQAEEDRFYAGGGVGFWNVSQNGHDNLFNVSSIEGLAGINVWRMINIEGRLGAGIEDSGELATNKQDGTLDTEVSLKSYASLYVKPELKNDIAKLYGLLGVTRLDADSTNAKTDRSLSLTGLSFGVGMGFQLSTSSVINIEYRRLVQDSDYRFSGFSVGFDIAF